MPEYTDYIGRDLEEAYLEFIPHTRRAGAKADKVGIDLIAWLPATNRFLVVQVKNSVYHACHHAAQVKKFGRLIPVVVGDPGKASSDECLQALITKGYWVGPANRQDAKVKVLADFYSVNARLVVRPCDMATAKKLCRLD